MFKFIYEQNDYILEWSVTSDKWMWSNIDQKWEKVNQKIENNS